MYVWMGISYRGDLGFEYDVERGVDVDWGDVKMLGRCL